MSSGWRKFDLRSVAPGGVLVVGRVVDQATVQDADEATVDRGLEQVRSLHGFHRFDSLMDRRDGSRNQRRTP
jgi:hypothetical protein